MWSVRAPRCARWPAMHRRCRCALLWVAAALPVAVPTSGGHDEASCLVLPKHGGWGAAQLPPGQSSRYSALGLQPQHATPFWRYRGGGRLDLPGLKALVEEIRAARPAGTNKSNIGGWQSPGNLLEVPWVGKRAAFQTLVAEINRQARAFVDAQAVAAGGDGAAPPQYVARLTRLWSNINGFADYNAPHTHSMCHYAGAMYVASGGDPEAALELLDPRPNLHGPAAALLHDRRRPDRRPAAAQHPDGWSGLPAAPWAAGVGRALPIEPGSAVLFPSWLAHWVQPHAGRHPRISFSFNIMIEPVVDDSTPLPSPPPPPPADERIDIARFSTPARTDTLRQGGRPGLPGAGLPAADPAAGHGLLELGWPTALWTAELGPAAGPAGYEKLAARLASEAVARLAEAGPRRKFKPNRHLVTSQQWEAAAEGEEEPLGGPLLGEQAGPLRKAIYAQLGWAAAELCGAVPASVGGAGLAWPPRGGPDGGAAANEGEHSVQDVAGGSLRVSARLLRSRPLALAGWQRHVLGGSPVGGGGGDGGPATLCGLVGLRHPAGLVGWLLLHDPRPALSFDLPHTAKGPHGLVRRRPPTVRCHRPSESDWGRCSGLLQGHSKTLFRVREGSVVLFPCWARYDLRLEVDELEEASPAAAAAAAAAQASGGASGGAGSGEDSPPHVFLEFTAVVEVDMDGEPKGGAEGGGGGEAGWPWLRVPAAEGSL